MFADIVFPVPFDKVFTYRVPPGMEGKVHPGSRVMAPFGRRVMTGYVVALGSTPPDSVKLKEIQRVVDEEPLLGEDLMDLARWIAEYYVHSLGEVLRTMLPASVRGEGRIRALPLPPGIFPEDADRPVLNGEQRKAFEAVLSDMDGGKGGEHLLYGVTGSGKTEVYLRCIEETLARGGSALVLIPEIALIPQTTARFQRRFSGEVAVLHSRLTGPQRSSIWKAAASGQCRVVIGPRSAVFVPLPRLGIIVVDEEEDSSFKQDEKPHYSAVEVARRRAGARKAVLLMGSATPSLEVYDLALRGDIQSHKLLERPNAGRMPSVEVVDMRAEEGLISARLLDELEGCLGRGEQAIVLINRRGHANYLQCRGCGWIGRCPRCSISLTYHSRGHALLCHYCGYRKPPPDRCPGCGGYKLAQRGAGTQRVEMELVNLLPSARIARMDLDSTRGKRSHAQILERFASREIDILLGTQMVAKGHHYPAVTVAGVLSADAGLNFPDFRAAERTYQLLSQTAGRTGRGGGAGKVIIQAYAPDHYIFKHLPGHDFDGFAAGELALRKELGYPPAGRLILFTISSAAAERAAEGAELAAGAIGKEGASAGVEVLGPAPALVEKLRGRHRIQILVRGAPDQEMKKRLVEAAASSIEGISDADLQWNVDPVNLF